MLPTGASATIFMEVRSMVTRYWLLLPPEALSPSPLLCGSPTRMAW